mmetsp:Transcript_8483/g.31932  ORF Transcript_8483/g.31932 Transcript_8483/m.31932 type:complete len:418 (+) Transcript_8483:1042-2295(+)
MLRRRGFRHKDGNRAGNEEHQDRNRQPGARLARSNTGVEQVIVEAEPEGEHEQAQDQKDAGVHLVCGQRDRQFPADREGKLHDEQNLLVQRLVQEIRVERLQLQDTLLDKRQLQVFVSVQPIERDLHVCAVRKPCRGKARKRTRKATQQKDNPLSLWQDVVQQTRASEQTFIGVHAHVHVSLLVFLAEVVVVAVVPRVPLDDHVVFRPARGGALALGRAGALLSLAGVVGHGFQYSPEAAQLGLAGLRCVEALRAEVLQLEEEPRCALRVSLREHHLPVVDVRCQHDEHEEDVHHEEDRRVVIRHDSVDEDAEDDQQAQRVHAHVSDESASRAHPAGTHDHRARHDRAHEHAGPRERAQAQKIAISSLAHRGDGGAGVRRAVAERQERHSREARRQAHVPRELLQRGREEVVGRRAQ